MPAVDTNALITAHIVMDMVSFRANYPYPPTYNLLVLVKHERRLLARGESEDTIVGIYITKIVYTHIHARTHTHLH